MKKQQIKVGNVWWTYGPMGFDVTNNFSRKPRWFKVIVKRKEGEADGWLVYNKKYGNFLRLRNELFTNEEAVVGRLQGYGGT